MMNDSKILALISGISEDSAIRLGALGIESVTGTASGIKFNLASGMSYAYNLSSNTALCYKSTYDTNNDGVIDKSATLKNNTDSTFNDGSYYLDRTKHTGKQTSDTVTLKGTPFTDVNRRFTGTTLEDFTKFLDTNKEFINGLYVGDNTKDGSFKLDVIDSKLVFSRRENGIWNQVQSIGSIETDEISLNHDASSIVFSEENNNREVNIVCKSAITSNGLRFGDARLDDLFLTADNVKQIKYIDDMVHNVYLQQDFSEMQQITTFDVDFTAPIQSDNNIVLLATDLVSINNKTSSDSVGFVITETLSGREIYRTASDFEIQQGIGLPLTTTGLHTVQLQRLFYFIAGRKYTIKFTSKQPITFYGKTVSGKFIPYIELSYKQCEYLPFFTTGDLTDSLTTSSSTKGASAKAVYDLKQAVDAVAGGNNPITPILIADLKALKAGVSGIHYILSDSGVLNGKPVNKMDNIFIVNTFDYTENVSPAPISITANDYVVIAQNSVPSGHVFITNVIATDSKMVSKTNNDYPDEATVKSITTDSNNIKVTLVWDRGQENFVGLPTVNGEAVVNIEPIISLGSTYKGDVTLSGDKFIDSLTAQYGTAVYTVGVTKVIPPVITNITFGSLPVGQTELKEGDMISISVTSDKDLNTVEMQDYGAFSLSTSYTLVGKTVTINGIIADRGTTLQELTAKLRVRSTDGSWSNIVETGDTLPLNNTQPTLIFGTATYPTTQSAIKGIESVDLGFTLSNTDLCTTSVVGDDLALSNQTLTGITATRLVTGTTTYNDGSTNNVAFTLKRNANGATTTYGYGVAIVTVPSILLSKSLPTYNIMSGVGSVVDILTFDQKVKVKSISPLDINKGTLATGTTSTYSNTYGLEISSQSTDIHSNVVNTTNIVVTGLSAIDSVNIPVDFYIRGFSNMILNLTYPEVTKAIGTTITDISRLSVSGKILSSPVFEIAKIYVSPTNILTELADKYSISSNGLEFLLPDSVKTFGYNTSQGIEITISENY